MRTLKFITVLAMLLALTAFAVNVEILDSEPLYGNNESLKERQDFFLQDADGNIISLEEKSKAKGFILIFTANEHPYSTAYEDKFIALNKKYEKLGYPVLLINQDEPTATSEDNLEYSSGGDEEQIKYLYLLDEDQKVLPHYSAGNDPLVYVLQKEPEGFEVKFMGPIKKTNEENDFASYGNHSHILSGMVKPEG